jgi:hypothetical protein
MSKSSPTDSRITSLDRGKGILTISDGVDTLTATRVKSNTHGAKDPYISVSADNVLLTREKAAMLIQFLTAFVDEEV